LFPSSVELSVSHKWASGHGGVGCSCRADPSDPHSPYPLPRSEAYFAESWDFEAGERGELGWNFYLGRRAKALALGYFLPPFQG